MLLRLGLPERAGDSGDALEVRSSLRSRKDAHGDELRSEHRIKIAEASAARKVVV